MSAIASAGFGTRTDGRGQRPWNNSCGTHECLPIAESFDGP
jgi:hypothetical protein